MPAQPFNDEPEDGSRSVELGAGHSYSARWSAHNDMIRTQIQETGHVHLSFLTLLDLASAIRDLGIDPECVTFKDGYAVVRR